MSHEKLRQDLEKLRQERDQVSPEQAETRRTLNGIIEDLEKRIEQPQDESLHHGLLEDLKTAVERFEAEHPRATAILNDIMVTLSNMGI